MRQSNTYIIIFTLVMTIVVGGVLAAANQLLKEDQKKSIEYDTKSQILSAVMDTKGADIMDVYSKRIKSIVVDINGEEITVGKDGAPVEAEKVDIAANFKLDYKERSYPVFMFMNESNPDKVEAYILPVYGSGLWDKIWGFIALKDDMNTIAGVSFAHKGETPGLGARISSPEVQGRFVGKTLNDENGNYVSVAFQKGEVGDAVYAADNHKVDGLSGATLTAKGVNNMMKKYMDYYQKYFKKVKRN